ncbi:MAG: hypothetical protein J7L64_05995 [Acidobacteria bacterium]|nr:hypothetical protein [Acidobacteriota bacterium]
MIRRSISFKAAGDIGGGVKLPVGGRFLIRVDYRLFLFKQGEKGDVFHRVTSGLGYRF